MYNIQQIIPESQLRQNFILCFLDLVRLEIIKIDLSFAAIISRKTTYHANQLFEFDFDQIDSIEWQKYIQEYNETTPYLMAETKQEMYEILRYVGSTSIYNEIVQNLYIKDIDYIYSIIKTN